MAKPARQKAAPKKLTTAQRLDSIIKSARKIMRKDKGLNGDLDVSVRLSRSDGVMECLLDVHQR